MLNSPFSSRDPLSTPVQFIKGVGPVVAKKLERLGAVSVRDLFTILPIRYQDRRVIYRIADLTVGRERTVCGRVIKSGVIFLGRKRVFEVLLSDDSGSISLKWFRFNQKSYETRFALGNVFMVSGELSYFKNKFQFIHPETEFVDAGDEVPSCKITSQIAGRVLPVYPLTEGVSQRQLRRIVVNAWGKYCNDIGQIIPHDICEKYSILPPKISLEQLHFPNDDVNIEILEGRSFPPRRSVIFDEFFFLELGLALKKKGVEELRTTPFSHDQKLYDKFCSLLPFDLTAAQRMVIDGLQGDLAKEKPMNRLLQGDVGSGKTVVALAASIQVLSKGCQVAMMAPTEILATQHHRKIEAMMKKLGFDCAILTSSIKGNERAKLLEDVKNGKILFLIGTHALIQDSVEFKNLGFVIVDEQHRFGVRQRGALKSKGREPHILIMTATPIPRTLALTAYGDLDVSVIDELPPGRTPIMTRLYSEAYRSKLYEGMKKVLIQGRQIYVVCPLIELSEELDLKAAQEVCKTMKEFFEPKFAVSLLHGRMKGDEKDKVMNEFCAGKIKILVTTTVIEVGVDVANATVMIIEHAQRFGLSQLHQLRGRVGRGDKQSYCILMTDYRQSLQAKERLKVMVETTDGFRIAEEDMSIRGPGEFLGTRQSGFPPFRVANLARDGRILQEAREAAFELLKSDPTLSSPRHRLLRETLLARWSGKLELAGIS